MMKINEKSADECAVEIAADVLQSYLLDAWDAGELSDLHAMIEERLATSHTNLKREILYQVFEAAMDESLAQADREDELKALKNLPNFFANVTRRVDEGSAGLAETYCKEFRDVGDFVQNQVSRAITEGIVEMYKTNAQAAKAFGNGVSDEQLTGERMEVFKKFGEAINERLKNPMGPRLVSNSEVLTGKKRGPL